MQLMACTCMYMYITCTVSEEYVYSIPIKMNCVCKLVYKIQFSGNNGKNEHTCTCKYMLCSLLPVHVHVPVHTCIYTLYNMYSIHVLYIYISCVYGSLDHIEQLVI